MGQTKRLLSTIRIEEHQDNIKKEENLPNVILKHILGNTDHSIDWKILKYCIKKLSGKKVHCRDDIHEKTKK